MASNAGKLLRAAAVIGLTIQMAACSPNQGDMGNKSIERVKQLTKENSPDPARFRDPDLRDGIDARYGAYGYGFDGKPNRGMNNMHGPGMYGPYGNSGMERYGHNPVYFSSDQLNEMNRKNGIRQNSRNVTSRKDDVTLQISQQMAEQIQGIHGVRSASVLLTGRNAYVAVTLDQGANSAAKPTGHAVPAALEKKIEQIVTRIDPSILNVNVSSDENFVQRMNFYANEWNQGHAIEGFKSEFNAMADRLFPKRTKEQK
jgi:YhcN/YlaJ family sporulation lipoprotein